MKKEKNIIFQEKVHQDYLEEYHRIIMETFIVSIVFSRIAQKKDLKKHEK